MRKQLRRVSLALAIGWPLIAVLSNYAATLFMRLDGHPARFPPLTWSIVAWSILSIFTPLIASIIHRFPLRRGRMLRTLLGHVLLCAAIATSHLALFLAIRGLFFPLREGELLRITASFGKYGVLTYCAIAAAVYLMSRHRQAQLSRLRRVRLERGIATARLQGAIISIDPPRVLQWLDDIGATVDRDPEAAMRKILDLSSDLRHRLRQRVDAVPDIRIPPLVEPIPAHRISIAVALLYPLYALYGTLINAGYDQISMGSYPGPLMMQSLLGYSIGGVLWPLVDRGSPRLAADEPRAKRNIVILALLCVAHALLAEACVSVLRHYFDIHFPAGWIFGPALLLSFVGANLLEGARYGERAVQERMRLQNVARDLAEARLRTLQTQLAPHFLFNALNSVLSLLEMNVGTAKRMLAGLRNVLYLSICHQSREIVTLGQDLELTMGYLDIEKIRFRDALEIEVRIDRSLEDASVPSFLLQPLVENAVRHGALGARGRGRIVLTAQRSNGGMEISVENDCELIESDTWKEGIGLSNIRRRLDHLYGSAHHFAVGVSEDQGFRVRIELPIP